MFAHPPGIVLVTSGGLPYRKTYKIRRSFYRNFRNQKQITYLSVDSGSITGVIFSTEEPVQELGHAIWSHWDAPSAARPPAGPVSSNKVSSNEVWSTKVSFQK